MFKKDDIVVCIETVGLKHLLPIGEMYKVTDIYHETSDISSGGFGGYFRDWRFRKATQQEVEEYNKQQESDMTQKAFADYPYFVMDSSGKIVKYCESYEDATNYARKQAAQVLGKKYHVLERTRSFIGTAVVQEENV